VQEGIAMTEQVALETGLKLDLVEISPISNPPVCQMINYSKYIFELKKKKDLQHKKQKRVKVKEIKLRPATEQNDYQVKLKHAIHFLQESDRVKVSMRFKGREMEHREIGQALLARLTEDISDYGTVEGTPKLEGRQITMLIVPKKNS